ncbi:MAG: class I SAM-dependent methyltransferase [Vulcanimicrobiaceae bacterium]
MDTIAEYKEGQKERWRHFLLTQERTAPAAGQLVKHAGIRAGQRVLDVACGTGVVAVTAARRGAHVTGLDLTPELLERAKENAEIAEVTVTWMEGDVEELPFANESFDVVTSQFGHIFAPRPDVALAQMLRVLKRGGTLAINTWASEMFTGRSMRLLASYTPPSPAGALSPALWGDPNVVRERLGDAVENISFHRDAMHVASLSPRHSRISMEKTSGPIIKLVERLSKDDPEKLARFRAEYEALAAEYFEDNILVRDFLITTATKK